MKLENALRRDRKRSNKYKRYKNRIKIDSSKMLANKLASDIRDNKLVELTILDAIASVKEVTMNE